MTVKELVAIEPKKIRSDSELMRLYIEFYKDAFSIEPNCAGCTFKSDFYKLKKLVTSGQTATKIIDMGIYKLNRKHGSDILTYRKDKKPHRIYGRDITDEFAENFLKHGTKKEIEDREKLFEKLPKVEKKKEKKAEKKSDK